MFIHWYKEEHRHRGISYVIPTVTDLQFIVDILEIKSQNFYSNPYIPKWDGAFVSLDLKVLCNLKNCIRYR